MSHRITPCSNFAPQGDPVKCLYCQQRWIDHPVETRHKFVTQASEGVVAMVEHRHSYKCQSNPQPCLKWRPINYGENIKICECGRMAYEHNLKIIKQIADTTPRTPISPKPVAVREAPAPLPDASQCPHSFPSGRTFYHCYKSKGHVGFHEHVGHDFEATWSSDTGMPVIISGGAITRGRKFGKAKALCHASFKLMEGVHTLCKKERGHSGDHADASTPPNTWPMNLPPCRGFVPEVDSPGLCKWCHRKYIDHEPGARGLELEGMTHIHSPGCRCIQAVGDVACTCLSDVSKQAMLDKIGEISAGVEPMLTEVCLLYQPAGDPQMIQICTCGLKFYGHTLDAKQGFGTWTEWRAAHMSNEDVIRWFVNLGDSPKARMTAIQRHLDHPSNMDPFAPSPKFIRIFVELLPMDYKALLPGRVKPIKPPPTDKNKPKSKHRGRRKGNGIIIHSNTPTALQVDALPEPRQCYCCPRTLVKGEYTVCKVCVSQMTEKGGWVAPEATDLVDVSKPEEKPLDPAEFNWEGL